MEVRCQRGRWSVRALRLLHAETSDELVKSLCSILLRVGANFGTYCFWSDSPL